jgi:hypothetical protein
MSQSMHKTRSPFSAKAVANAAQTDVLPVPPLPDRIVITSPMTAPPFCWISEFIIKE